MIRVAWWLPLILFSLFYFGVIANAINNNKINAFDYGIYQQALFDIAAGVSLNPYNTIRNVRIFDEHFDPIVILVAPITRLLNYHVYSPLIIEMLFVLASFLFLFFFFKDEKPSVKILAMAFLLFSRPMLTAIFYPVHPSTWAIFPMTLMVYFLSKNRHTETLVVGSLLLFFKETFPFALFGFSFYFLLEKKYKHFVVLLLLSSFFIALELGLRKFFIKETISYGGSYARDILQNPLSVARDVGVTLFSGAFVKVVIPYFVPVLILMKYGSQDQKRVFRGLLLFLLPLVGIHLIIQRFFFHHALQFGIILSAGLIFTKVFSLDIFKKRIVYFGVLLITLVSGMSAYQKGFRGFFKNNDHQFLQVVNVIKASYMPTEKIYATGGFVVRLLKPDMQIFHHQMSKEQESYQYLALEKPPYGDSWPLSSKQVASIIEKCRAFSKEVIETEAYFYAKGEFPRGCIY